MTQLELVGPPAPQAAYPSASVAERQAEPASGPAVVADAPHSDSAEGRPEASADVPPSTTTRVESPRRRQRLVLAPGVVGLPARDAIQTLRASALNPAIEHHESDDSSEHGTVLAQEPPPGEPLARGATLALWVGAPVAERHGEVPVYDGTSPLDSDPAAATAEEPPAAEPAQAEMYDRDRAYVDGDEDHWFTFDATRDQLLPAAPDDDRDAETPIASKGSGRRRNTLIAMTGAAALVALGTSLAQRAATPANRPSTAAIPTAAAISGRPRARRRTATQPLRQGEPPERVLTSPRPHQGARITAHRRAAHPPSAGLAGSVSHPSAAAAATGPAPAAAPIPSSALTPRIRGRVPHRRARQAHSSGNSARHS
jgi:hypothetical protein